MKKKVKHVDGVTVVIAKGYVKDGIFYGEYKYKGMFYGVTVSV